ncbi:MAG: dipeptidase PepV [Firmicutes bacterium]|nr:dipeptidase PepV [Bacillota bacterium]
MSDMIRLEEVYKKIEDSQAEMVSSLSALISVPSVSVKTPGDKPFGENVHKAYEMMMGYGQDAGFLTYNADNYGGHIEFPGSGAGIIGIAGHLDVVPEGEGWDHEPYSGDVVDGFIWGRGTIDNKGPVVASFYAMKALKECGYVPEKSIRMILGLDEETNWDGMRYYLSHVDRIPDCGFTPDADFPVIRAEMGILIFDIVKKLPASRGKGLELRGIKGGTVPNAVAENARAVICDTTGGGYEYIKAMVNKAREEKGWKINCKGLGKSFEITVKGVPAHGAMPELGQNAITILMEFLGGLNFLNDGVNDFIKFYNECIGFNLHGEKIGCYMSDEDSGQLKFNVGMIDVDKNTADLKINIRFPVTCARDDVYDGIMNVIDKYGMGIVKGEYQAPIYFPEDNELVQTLLDVYRKHTGDMETAPIVTGGGTYARALPNCVAFGSLFPGDPELEHQRNERVEISKLVQMSKIYAEAIYRLAGQAM